MARTPWRPVERKTSWRRLALATWRAPDDPTVYGTIDAGGAAPADLDSCNGHTAATADFPAGIYHYHTTSGVPYISGCFAGTPGTVTGG